VKKLLGLALLCVGIALNAASLSAAPLGAIHGRIVASRADSDLAGAIVKARLRGAASAVVATTGENGSFRLPDLRPGTYVLTVDGRFQELAPYTVAIVGGMTKTVRLKVLAVVSHIIIKGHSVRPLPTYSKVFRTAQTQVLLGKTQIASQGALAGSAQLLQTAPGVLVSSYGSTGAAKSMITVRGFKQGWANQAGIVDNGMIGVTLNGVFLNNPQTGQWQADEIPDLSILDGMAVEYGPGSPVTRTFDSIGGTLNFYTQLPKDAPHLHLSGASGSYGGSAFHVDFSAPLSKHLGFIISHGRTFTQGYRNIIGSGTTAPGSTYASFGEIVDKFEHGSLDVFGYSASGTEMRPNLIPLSPLQNYDGNGNPIAGSYVTANGFDLNGNPIPGATYSQQTSGFYSALPLNVWQKTDSNSTRLLAADLELGLKNGWSLSNILAYRHGDRLHQKNFNWDQANNNQRFEYNNPFSNALSEKLTFHHVNARNGDALDIGSELFGSLYNTRNAFYNPDPVQSAPSAPSTILQPTVFRNNNFQQKNFTFFGQYLMRLGKRWKFTPGFRYVSLATNFLNSGLEGFPQCNGVPSSAGICSNKTKLGDSGTVFAGIEPSAELQFLANPNLAIYANFGRALRSPQTSPGGPYQGIPVAGLSPETGTNQEVGVKYFRRFAGRMLDGSPREAFLTASFFDERVRDQYIPIVIGAGVKVASASGSSRYSGLTLAFDRTFGRSIELFGGLSTTHAYFDSYDYLGTNYSGLPVTQVPKFAYNFGIAGQERAGTGFVTGRLWENFTGPQAMWNNLLGQPDPNGLQIPSYSVTNASIGYETASVGKPIGFTLSVNNLFNKQYNSFEYVTSGAYFGGGIGQSNLAGPGAILGEPGAPREVQFTVSLRD